MKTQKKILIIILSFMILFFNYKTVLAYNNPDEKFITINESDNYFINNIFLNQNNIIITDTENNIITEKYFTDTSLLFENNNYELLNSYISDNVKMICIDKSYSNSTLRSPFVTQNVKKDFYIIANKEEAVGRINYRISGIFIWDRATNKITSTSDAKVSIISHALGESWAVGFKSAECNAIIASNKYSVTYQANFMIRAQHYKNSSFDKDVILGPYSNSFTAYPSDFE